MFKSVFDTADCHRFSYISLSQKALVNSKLNIVTATQQARESSITNCCGHVVSVVLENVNRSVQNTPHPHCVIICTWYSVTRVWTLRLLSSIHCTIKLIRATLLVQISAVKLKAKMSSKGHAALVIRCLWYSDSWESPRPSTKRRLRRIFYFNDNHWSSRAMFLARASAIFTVCGLSLDIFSHLPSISWMWPLLAASISKLFELCVVLALLMFSQIAWLKELLFIPTNLF